MKFIEKLLLIISFKYIFFCCNMRTEKEIKSNRSYAEELSIINFSTKEVDFGTISKDTVVDAIFYIKNSGQNTLFIKEVDPEFSCSSYELKNKIIEHGDSTRLKIIFNTKDKTQGFQRK
ncbi:MAG: DUF1573 domain-containing protein [Cyclobacteriaceae bacterium]